MMGIMGWSHSAMAQRYAHMVDPVRDEIASRVNDLIWTTQELQAAPEAVDDR